MNTTRRKKKLIKPGWQLKLILTFASMAVIAVVVQAGMTFYTLTTVSHELPSEGVLLLDAMERAVLRNLLFTCAFLLPVMVGIGLIATFQVAGPMYRFEQYLKSLLDGTSDGPCRLRASDSMQDFCKLLNRATAPLRDTKDDPDTPPSWEDVAA